MKVDHIVCNYCEKVILKENECHQVISISTNKIDNKDSEFSIKIVHPKKMQFQYIIIKNNSLDFCNMECLINFLKMFQDGKIGRTSNKSILQIINKEKNNER